MKNIFAPKNFCPLYIELREGKTLLSEGYCRVEQYTEKLVVLASDNCFLHIRGEGLVIRRLSKERAAVDGRIDGIDLVRDIKKPSR